LLDELQEARLTSEAQLQEARLTSEAQLQEARLTLEAVYRSRSWRITKPIRALTTRLRRLAWTAVDRVDRRT
jgi:hypothetical protein